jgi:transcriptional regulator with XRE-family HTH domain
MDDLTYQPVKHDPKEFLRKAMENEEFREGYEAVARKIGTTKSAISRLEGGSQHSPSIATLRKYAEAVGCDLVIKLEPKRKTADA